MCRDIRKRISILETPMNMQTHSSYLFRETWRIARRLLIVVMNVPIRKTDLTRAGRTWDGEAYLGHCIARQTKKERREISKRGRELEAKGASDRALFKDLKERRFDVLVNTYGVNLLADPSRKIRNHPHAGTRPSSSPSTMPEVADFSRSLSRRSPPLAIYGQHLFCRREYKYIAVNLI